MGGELEEEMMIAIICDRMGWTYDEYLSQPVSFINTLTLKWSLENEHQDKMNKQK